MALHVKQHDRQHALHGFGNGKAKLEEKKRKL
ncbi:hypothetical protein COLO4_13252 [Corchorus olitorius]|uniref:Uncharacterized protein n=1 Tax=Corchorus olitorius TaxID=93759 RepID=A0A1R3JXE6_9ROSI|nr:hypothetical protein COLO4_13252 [Corchorus olitorius]